MNPTTTTTIDAADAVELAEICEFLAERLDGDRAAAASYDHHVGRAGQADELRADLGRLARLLTGETAR